MPETVPRISRRFIQACRKDTYCHLSVTPGGHKLQVLVQGARNRQALKEGGDPFLVEAGSKNKKDLQLR